jgi:CelD/BcsL family acetyltransferase involved in cellulose biosynthesis
MYTVKAVHSFDEFVKLEPIWNRLLAQSDNDIPYMTFEWFCFFWKKLCSPGKPLVLILSHGGEPSAVIPLMRQKIFWRNLPVTCLSFLSNAFAARTGIIRTGRGDDRIFDAAFRFLKTTGYDFDLFWSERVIKGSDTDRLLRKYVEETSLGLQMMEGNSSPYIVTQGSWEEYLRGRSKHQRFNIRHVNKLYERLNYSLRTFTSDGLDEAAEKMLLISRNSWKHQEGKAITNQKEKTDYYRDLLYIAAKAGWLRFHLLEINGRPAAFLYTLKYGNKVYLLEIYYHEDMKEFTPGNFLSNYVIKESFDTGCDECEFLGNTDGWKLRLTSDAHSHGKYWIFNNTPYGKLLYAWEKGVVTAAKFFKKKMFSPPPRPKAAAGHQQENQAPAVPVG